RTRCSSDSSKSITMGDRPAARAPQFLDYATLPPLRPPCPAGRRGKAASPSQYFSSDASFALGRLAGAARTLSGAIPLLGAGGGEPLYHDSLFRARELGGVRLPIGDVQCLFRFEGQRLAADGDLAGARHDVEDLRRSRVRVARHLRARVRLQN